ncbi:MAG TPA: NUDIX domain-containing protein [Chloroflexia bacterium]|nr:NUDIX domain-containing protein [Chloroflexia bacterium]
MKQKDKAKNSKKKIKKVRLRPLALAVIRKDDQLLLMEGYDKLKKETFYRPLGGGIEFGETSQEAVEREIMEELGAELINIHFLGIAENLFVFNGEPGHEIVMLFGGDFKDKSFYDNTEFNYIDGKGKQKVRAVWVELSRFQAGENPLYPDGLLEIVTKETNAGDCYHRSISRQNQAE